MVREHARPWITTAGVDQHRRNVKTVVLQPQGNACETCASAGAADKQDFPPGPDVDSKMRAHRIAKRGYWVPQEQLEHDLSVWLSTHNSFPTESWINAKGERKLEHLSNK